MFSPAGIGFTSASCMAYSTMNGVMNASVSLGSSQRAASVTCTPQVMRAVRGGVGGRRK